MITIYKYPLYATDQQTVWLPEGASVIRVAPQGAELFLWAWLNTDKPARPRTFKIYGTGWEMPNDGKHVYIGTFDKIGIMGEPLVFHLFEVLP
jgi:hypothetical protein